MNVQEYKFWNPDLGKHPNLNTSPKHFFVQDVWDESMHYKVWHNDQQSVTLIGEHDYLALKTSVLIF